MEAAMFDSALAAMLDHTLLKPEATEAEVLRLCDEARQYGFASVCVNPSWVRLSAEALSGEASRICTVIGFPLGSNRSDLKIREAELAAADGAQEFDMVLNIGRLKGGDVTFVEHDITAVAAALREISPTFILKVILETCLLTNEEIVTACRIAERSGADFVKTSTGFSKSGASLDVVRLMRSSVGESIGVKASGGIRDHTAAISMIEAGANRIGTSSSIAIVST